VTHVTLKLVAVVVAMIPWAGVAAAIIWIFRRWRIRVAIVGPDSVEKQNLRRAESRQEGETTP
jgi:hypothetical protein